MFPPDKISAFEVALQDRKQLKNLQDLKSGPFFDSVQEIISQLKKTMSPKSTLANGMAMRGEDLVKMIRKLFTALESDNITTLETAYERLEKQMCDSYYSDWIAPLLGMSEEEFMSKADHHLTEFTGQCKIDSYTERIKQEIRSKRDGIIREREEREKRRKAEEGGGGRKEGTGSSKEGRGRAEKGRGETKDCRGRAKEGRRETKERRSRKSEGSGETEAGRGGRKEGTGNPEESRGRAEKGRGETKDCRGRAKEGRRETKERRSRKSEGSGETEAGRGADKTGNSQSKSS